MAYDREFLKITFGFTITGTDEQAVTSINFSEVANTSVNAQAALGEINMPVLGPLLLARMSTLLNSASIFWAVYSRLNYVRIAAVSAPGPEFAVVKLFEDTTPDAGNDDGVLPQCSIVLSLRSGFTTGSANYGRMFLPHTMHPLASSTPRAAVANTGAFATAAQTFVSGLNTDLNGQVSAVMDPMIMTQVASASSRRVTQIAIGDINDTQRRRRNQLPEIYTFRTIP